MFERKYKAIINLNLIPNKKDFDNNKLEFIILEQTMRSTKDLKEIVGGVRQKSNTLNLIDANKASKQYNTVANRIEEELDEE